MLFLRPVLFQDTTREKLAANIFASWLHSDLRSSLVISAAESSQKSTWTQHDVMASARSQSIQVVGPLGVSQLCSLGMQSVTHSLHLTLCKSEPGGRAT